MALVHYNDLYYTVDIDDDMYNNNLARQIADIVIVEPSAYSCKEMEDLVDCVHGIRDILTKDRGYSVQTHIIPHFDYIHTRVQWDHFYIDEIGEIAAFHRIMKRIIEN